MPGFVIAIGGSRQGVGAMLTRREGYAALGIGAPVLKDLGPALTVWEFCGEGGGGCPELSFVSDATAGRSLFLIGYLTGPQAVSRQKGEEDRPKLLSLMRSLRGDWAQSGESLQQLDGSFALISIEARDGAVAIHSDRYASRSVWRAWSKGSWLLASHPVLLWLALGGRHPVDPAAVGSLLLRARPSGDRALLSTGTRNLPGSSLSLAADGSERCRRWFRATYEPDDAVSAQEWGERVAAVLQGATRRLRGVMERPLLFLSGGLDSRLALSALAPHDPLCVTLCDGKNYETTTAGKAASAVGACHRLVTRDKEWYLRVMPRAALLQGGAYHPVHSHFSEGLRTMGADTSYDTVLLGDFLEVFQKLMGKHLEVLGKRPRPETLCDHILTLDGQYAAPEGMAALRCLREPLRQRVAEAWRSELSQAAAEALEVSREVGISVDYLLRWRAAYELATYGMIEDVRSLAAERSLSMDKELHDLMLAIPERHRREGRISLEALRRLAPALCSIPNANTMLRADAPAWCHDAVRRLRPLVGAARQAFNRRFRITDAVRAGSWTDCRLLAATDPEWISFIDEVFQHPAAFPDTIFETRTVQETWRRYRGGELSLGFSINSLLTFGLVHRHYGSGEIA